jgi:hypothetical protein
MDISSRQISYFEVSPGLAARIGSGAADDVLWCANTDPSVRLCVREPLHPRKHVRMRFGSATLTDEGPVPDFCTDPSQRLGAWCAAVYRAFHAIQALSRSPDALNSLPAEPITTWWLMDSTTNELKRIPSPDRYWLDQEAPEPELLRDLLVRVSGPAGVLVDLLLAVQQECAAIDQVGLTDRDHPD